MTGSFRPIASYLKETARLTFNQFLKKYNHPVLLWPQAGDWIEDTAFQFETFSSEYTEELPGPISPSTESQITKTVVVEVLKQASSAPTNMICVGRAANNDIVLVTIPFPSCTPISWSQKREILTTLLTPILPMVP
jgi:hypothetical protein